MLFDGFSVLEVVVFGVFDVDGVVVEVVVVGVVVVVDDLEGVVIDESDVVFVGSWLVEGVVDVGCFFSGEVRIFMVFSFLCSFVLLVYHMCTWCCQLVGWCVVSHVYGVWFW